MAHTVAQPGLHAHSWNPEVDLMKRYVVERKTPSGWLAIGSYNGALEAEDSDLIFGKGGKCRIFDQYRMEVVK